MTYLYNAPAVLIVQHFDRTVTLAVTAQMATLDKAEALLEDLRSASWDAAVKDLDDVKAFAAKQVCMQASRPTVTACFNPSSGYLLAVTTHHTTSAACECKFVQCNVLIASFQDSCSNGPPYAGCYTHGHKYMNISSNITLL